MKPTAAGSRIGARRGAGGLGQRFGKVAWGRGGIVGMTLFGRYIFRQALGALLMILLSLTAVVWIAMALKQLSVVTSGGAGGVAVLKITALILPDIITMIAPIALLIAALHTLNKLNQDSELIVMTAAGATLWRFAKPLLLLAFVVAGWLMLANFYVTPWSLRSLNDLFNELKTDLLSQALEPGSFASPEDGLTFHIRERGNDGRMLGLMLSDTRSGTVQLTYIANSGDVIKRDDKAYLVLHDGKVIRRSAGQETVVIEFESYVLDMATASQKGVADTPKPHARYIGELLYPDTTDSHYIANPGSFRSELHERFASLLYPFVFIAIVVAYLGQARTNRQSRGQGQIAAFSIAAGLRLAGIAATNMLSSNAWAIVLVYGLPLGGLAFAVMVGWSGMSPRRSGAFATRISALHEEAVAALLRLAGPIAALRKGAG